MGGRESGKGRREGGEDTRRGSDNRGLFLVLFLCFSLIRQTGVRGIPIAGYRETDTERRAYISQQRRRTEDET